LRHEDCALAAAFVLHSNYCQRCAAALHLHWLLIHVDTSGTVKAVLRGQSRHPTGYRLVVAVVHVDRPAALRVGRAHGQPVRGPQPAGGRH
jgi:hypothetical protein